MASNDDQFEDSGEIIFKPQDLGLDECEQDHSSSSSKQTSDTGTAEKANELLLEAIQSMSKEFSQFKENMGEQISEIKRDSRRFREEIDFIKHTGHSSGDSYRPSLPRYGGPSNFNNHSPILESGENIRQWHFDIPLRDFNLNDNRISSPYQQKSAVNVRPPTFDGTEDFGEYLVQFEILVDLHQWDYRMKSLYLASSLIGNARALLSELSDTQRRDFDSLVSILNRRFGSVERSEIFRAKLKNRTKMENESLSALAQSIKKLTRQAYPTADPDLTNILSLDHFVDALPDPDMRLRLRESRPKHINEAETLAIRLETHKLADAQRVQRVNHIQANTHDNDLLTSIRQENRALRQDLQSLTREIQSLFKGHQDDQTRNDQVNWSHNRSNYQCKEPQNDRPKRARDDNFRPRGTFSSKGHNQMKDYRRGNKTPYKQNPPQNQGNYPRSNSGVGNRPTGSDPNLM